jgi:hypothetical protein
MTENYTYRFLQKNDIEDVVSLLQLQLGEKCENFAQIKKFVQAPNGLAIGAFDGVNLVGVILSADAISRAIIQRIVVNPDYGSVTF